MNTNIVGTSIPEMLALEAELLKRFQPLRARLTPAEKSRLTKSIKEVGFTPIIAFTKDPTTRSLDDWYEKIMVFADRVLALLLEGESKQDFDKVLAKYAEKHAKWQKKHDARQAERWAAARATVAAAGK
jgi:hypothetical protein